jgi:hypothetical protein
LPLDRTSCKLERHTTENRWYREFKEPEMAEDSTRKLLKVFGVAVTDFEDRCLQIAQQARDAADQGGDPTAFLPFLEGLVRSTSEVSKRWMEVTQFIVEHQNRTHAEVLGFLEELRKRRGLST